MTSPRFLRLAVVAALFGLTLTACDNTAVDNPDQSLAPVVLTPSAFSLDADSFPSTSSAAANVVSGPHHTRAFLTVAIVTAAVGLNLIVPSAATQAATQATPFVENGVWIWQNTVPINGENVTFRLEADPAGTEIDWQMIISAAYLNGETYDEFTLYTATTAINGRSGDWSLFYRIDGQSTRVLDAVYDETSSTARELTFSVPETNPDEDARGATVFYMADGDMRLFDFQEPTPNQNHLVEWDAVTHAGFIEAYDYNGGNRACWDENLNNVDCVSS